MVSNGGMAFREKNSATQNYIDMNYGYIRVSTDRQTQDNQRYEICGFCKKENLKVDGWIQETISGTKAYDKRALGRLLRKVKPGDLIVCSELSRLGRSLFMIMNILNICMEKQCRVWTIKEGYRLGDDIQSKVLAFAFGISAEIERNLISQRTKEALGRKRAEGVRLGRPSGAKNRRYRLDCKREIIFQMLSQGCSHAKVATRCGVSRTTLERWLKKERGVV